MLMITTILRFIGLTIKLILLMYSIVLIVLIIRNARYQKLWNLKKATLLRVDPMISRGDLCEQIVMFCKRNDCRIDF